jgi:soluble lytic murein transglycosylase-like protein
MPRIILLVAALAALTPAVADAQIYAWRDASGNLVMSDKPKNAAAKTYAVATTGSFRTTKPIVTTRAAQYEGLIQDHASRHGLSPDFVRAVIQAESAFNPRARSAKGAMGLMQLMPETAAQYGVRNAYDPAENIRAGVAYLDSLLERYDHDESLALAAYNAGPGAVEKYGRTVPPYKETRNYIARIRKAAPSTARSATGVFRTVEIVDGHEVVRYTNKNSKGAAALAHAGIRNP